MKKIFFISLLFVSEITLAFDAKPVLDSANRAYIKGEFSRASSLYEAILQNGYESADLYFNLGNAYFKQNKIADAILNYERAKKFSPKDEDINYNLSVANRQTTDKIEAVNVVSVKGWWQSFCAWMSVDAWAGTALLLLTLALAAFILFVTGKSVPLRKTGFTTGVILGLLFSFTLAVTISQYAYSTRQDSGIVYKDELRVKSSPGESGKDIFIIHLGTRVEVTQELNGWVEIRLSNKNTGWVKEGDVRMI